MPVINFGNLSENLSYPTLSPTLDFNFVNSTVLDPRITFTRNDVTNCATIFNSLGILTTVGANVPRFDYNPLTLEPRGLLIEEARTNFFTNAGSFSGGTIGTGSVIGPDNVACRTFIPTLGAANFPNVIGPNQSFSLTLGQTVDWALSGWIAAGPAGTPTLEPRFVFSVSVNNVSSFIYAEIQINTSNWTVRTKALGAGLSEVSAPTITFFKTGLYRLTWVVRYTQDATNRNTVNTSLQPRDTSGSGTYTADGVSGVQYALVQAETGSAVTSTIPTTNTVLTRAADLASVNNLGPWYNSVAGTLYGEFLIPPNLAAFPGSTASLSDGTSNNQIAPYAFTSGLYTTIRTGNVAQGDPGVLDTPIIGSIAKYAIALETNNCVSAWNGIVGPVDTSVTLPTVTQLRLGVNGAGVGWSNTWLRRLTYYPSRFINAELQILTQ